MKVAESLVAAGIVGAEQMRGMVAQYGNGRELRAKVVAERIATEREIAEAVAQQSGIPFLDLTQEALTSEVVSTVPAALCRRYQLSPVRRTRRHLVVGMLDPQDLIAIDDLGSVTGYSIAPVTVSADALELAFGRFLRMDDELSELTDQMVDDSTVELEDPSLSGGSDDAPVVRFVSLLISQAIDDRASDIHIEPGEKVLTVRYRIDGVLQETQQASRAIQDGVISRLKIMAAVDIAERRKPQDGRISVQHNGRKVDLRLATLPTVWGEKIVMRILDNSTASLDLRDLSFGDENYEVYSEAYRKPYGMILVTGPTGSGKSTTLYATLNAVSRPEINVITVEDPVEYRLPGINQVQVNPKAGLTFAGALRSILRSDPDVVLLGEIRDHETAQIAIEAALTGHLVLSTLHTNDAPSAITRLVEMGIEPFLVGSALDCVVAQRLARRLCKKCKEPYEPSDEELLASRFPWVPGEPKPILHRPAGCTTCSRTGYRGRLALHEVMRVTEGIERHAVSGSSAADIGRTALDEGMRSLRMDGWQKVAAGDTSIEEILRVVA